MGLRIVLDCRKHLRVRVTDAFDCEIARDALRRIRKNWPMRASRVHIDLSEVTRFRPGAIELLVLLHDMTGGEFLPEGCGDELKTAYASALKGATAASGAGAACRQCLSGELADACVREDRS